MKKSKKTQLTDEHLQILFDGFNETFFNGRINPGVRTKFVDDKKLKNSNKTYYSDARWNPKTQEIWIDRIYSGSEPITCILLLHEMAHAVLQSTYIGHPTSNPGHGMIYQAELHRLFLAGAYDGLL